MQVNMFPRGNILGGGPDGHPVLENLLTGRDGPGGELVAERESPGHHHRLAGHADRGTGLQSLNGDQDIIRRVEQQQARVIHAFRANILPPTRRRGKR
jgi:hypothetical protein